MDTQVSDKVYDNSCVLYEVITDDEERTDRYTSAHRSILCAKKQFFEGEVLAHIYCGVDPRLATESVVRSCRTKLGNCEILVAVTLTSAMKEEDQQKCQSGSWRLFRPELE